MPSPSLTIAIASTQRHWHGGEEQARLLAVGLRQRGHRCVFLARRDGALAQRMAADGFEVFSFAGGGRSPLALWQIRRHLRRIAPDVLHYNDSHALMGAGLAALGLRIPARIVARRVDFPLRSTRPYRWFSDRVVCVSRAVAEVCAAGGIPAEMLGVVHDGVDPARVRSGDRQRGRRSLGLTDDQALLLTVAKLTDHKGHRFLLDALPAVIQKVSNVVLALAGDGELREVLERQAQQLGIQSHVRFLGYRDDVPDLIHAADVFVLPSHMEGLCSTLIDVMLAGRPIVTTTAGGIPDLVGSDEPGTERVAWTVPPCDSMRLAEAILRALASPGECAAMQQRACRRAEQLFTAECMVDATLKMYRGVMKRMRDEGCETRDRR
jgi:L-malate glycosyltransferase